MCGVKRLRAKVYDRIKLPTGQVTLDILKRYVENRAYDAANFEKNSRIREKGGEAKAGGLLLEIQHKQCICRNCSNGEIA